MTHLQQARSLLQQGHSKFTKFVEDNRGVSIFGEEIDLWVVYMKGTAMPINRDVAHHLSYVYPSWKETPAIVAEFIWYVRSYDELIEHWENGTRNPAWTPTIGRAFPGGLDAFLATE